MLVTTILFSAFLYNLSFPLDTAWIKGGETWCTQPKDLCLKLDSVLMDGRCSEGVTCKTYGTVALRVLANNTDTLVFITGDPHAEWPTLVKTIFYDGHRVRVREITPEKPGGGLQLTLSDYLVSFLIDTVMEDALEEREKEFKNASFLSASPNPFRMSTIF